MLGLLRPPTILPTTPPGVVPGERRYTWEQLLNKPGSSGSPNTIDPSGILGQITTTRKFLRSKGDGTNPGVPAWDTLLIADVVGDTSATRKFAKSVGTGAAGQPASWDTLVAADVVGDIAATRKFLRSLGSGAAPGVTVWDTLTAADIGAGTFPSGAFTFPSTVTGNAGFTAKGDTSFFRTLDSLGTTQTVFIGSIFGWLGAGSTTDAAIGAANALNFYPSFLSTAALKLDNSAAAGETRALIYCVDTATVRRVKTTAAGVAPGAGDRTLYV